MSEAEASALALLAERVGIVPEYIDQTGTERRVTTDDTRRALLSAMGIDASTDAAARASLAVLRAEEARELIAPVRVVRLDDANALVLDVRVPAACANNGSWRIEIETEDGERRVTNGPWLGDQKLELATAALPLGYHTLRVALSTGGAEWTADQSVIVAPPQCTSPDRLLGQRDAFGIVANLYTVRSHGNWGVGDFTDLSALAEWSASTGADFVGMNPLHALMNRGNEISPYSPVSRLFRNPIYIDVTHVPELRDAPDVGDRLRSPEVSARLDALRESPKVQYEQVMAVKGLALDALHRVFAERVRDSGDPRARAYAAFVAANEPNLTRFAHWMAIAEREGSSWRTWPAELRDRDGGAVQRFASEHAERVDFHRWLQFELDRQLGEAAGVARAGDMRIGLYQDLAIGTSDSGADTWAFPDLFVRGASVGAPPDPLGPTGQNWGLPPIDPRVLRRTRYRYFIDLLRSALRHSGALRIDHALGLFRLFWIPEGKEGKDGAYVCYPSEDLLGIVALESVRNNALVVGEDLGTIPPEVPRALERWGVLSSKVFFFERDNRGGFTPGNRYKPLALATADTHDMPTIAGFWDGRDIDLRARLGLITAPDAETERARRDGDRTALLERLSAEQLIPDARPPNTPAELAGAVHGFLCRTPSRLVGLALDDLAGEVDPVNVPGVGPDKFPSWTRKMREPLEVIAASDHTRIALRCDGRRGVRDA